MTHAVQTEADWGASDTAAALASAQVALWRWNPSLDRMTVTGAAGAVGLGPMMPECSSAAFLAMILPKDIEQARTFLETQAPGSPIYMRLQSRQAEACIWRGLWRVNGCASGIVVREAQFAAPRLDELTGLLDRKTFVLRLRDRLKLPGPYDLVVADLDRLRRLNEALGHERTDLVLATLGSRLAAAFGPEAILARIGEDEFAVLLAASDADASARVREALEQPLKVAGFDIHPSLSIGAVRVEGGEDALEAGELLRRAELAVEAAKAVGGGGVAAYGRSMESDGLSRLALEADLRGAIGRGEIVPYFQPVVHLASGRLAGFEALARWRHPRRGLLMPGTFLPLCRDMGLLSELGAHMLRTSAHQLASWRGYNADAANLTCSVNLSTGEIERPGLVEDVSRVIQEAGLPAGAIKLELTESDIMRDPQKASLVLSQLRAVGAGLSLDDFGTGFSSLSYLTRLPFDVLKIDCYFVRTMEFNEGSAKIVRSVINLGRELSLEIVAEGIENANIAKQLLNLGCDFGQGFGYAPALSVKDAQIYLEQPQIQSPLKAHS